ncbi:MAG: pyridoxamine 5'-phosphate oxidase family protein [Paracoccaceae bacterium]
MADAHDKLWELIDGNRYCMMVTEGDPVSGEAKMHARPMQAIPERGDNRIWFFTRLNSGKTEDLKRDGIVCVAFSDPSKGDYVSVTGHAELSQDRDKIKEHWNTFVDAWFPEGPDGEDVGLIKVVLESGEYWENPSSGLITAAKTAIASKQDKLPNMGEHEKVSFR